MPDALTTLGNPELDQIVLTLVSAGLSITDWLSYSYNEAFLTPCDGWTFVLDSTLLTDAHRRAIYPGAKVALTINGRTQSTGAIDVADYKNDRSAGSILTISGRDILAPLVSGGIDPSLRFAESQTLADIIKAVLTEYKLPPAVIDNDANRNIITGANRGPHTSKKGKPLPHFQAHQTKPFINEGAFQFLERLCKRFGLWIWPSADGQSIIVSKPNFDQDPSGILQRKRDDDGGNNITSGGTKFDATDQPAAILACGFGGGGEFPKANFRGAIINPLVVADLSTVKARWPDITFNQYEPGPSGIQPFAIAAPVVSYLSDDDSKTPEELTSFLYHAMSTHLLKAVSSHYAIEGHSLGGNPIAVDTVIYVHDDESGPNGFHAPMWVMDRSLHKARDGGTHTEISLIPLNSLVLQ